MASLEMHPCDLHLLPRELVVLVALVASGREAGAADLLAPAAPGLLVVLPNRDAEDDRSDLQLTYG